MLTISFIDAIVIISVILMVAIFSMVFILARTNYEIEKTKENVYTFDRTKTLLGIAAIFILFCFVNSFYILMFSEFPLESLDKFQTKAFLIVIPLLVGIASFFYGVLDYVFESSRKLSFSNLLLFLLFAAVIIYMIILEIEFFNSNFSI